MPAQLRAARLDVVCRCCAAGRRKPAMPPLCRAAARCLRHAAAADVLLLIRVDAIYA